MNKTKLGKFLITLLCFVIVVSMSLFNVVMAAGANPSTSSKITPNDIVPNSNGTNDIITVGQNVAGIVQIVGIIVSVVILMVLGIKYMMGSAEEKAEYKKTFIPYIVGAVILFAASALAQKIYTWASAIS